MQRRHENRRPICATLAASLAMVSSSNAQSLCDVYHVPAEHIGNVESCVFGGNNTTTITFNAPAILEWRDGFKIEAGQTLRFAFPGFDNGAVLNRDLSGGNSDITGSVTSDGRVLLINPGGSIYVQDSGLIDADGGFLAATLDTQEDESLLAGGNTEFSGGAPLTGINNYGTIRSANGDVILVAQSITNFEGGQILAPSGSIHIGAGTRIRLAAAGEPRISVLEGEPIHTIANDDGATIQAANTIDLSAYTAAPVPVGDDRNPSIANNGRIRTTSSTGRVFLRALPGRGQILNSPSGTITSADVDIQGERINEGSIIEPDDGANPGAPTGTRQFPRLTDNSLAQTANSDFRLSRLSFSHLNGLESKPTKKAKTRASKKITSTVAANTRTTTRGSADDAKKKKSTSTGGKKIVLRRGSFFGKKTQ